MRFEPGRKLFQDWSRDLIVYAQQIAIESDRWFLSFVSVLDRGADGAHAGVGRLLDALPRLRSRQSAQVRIQRTIFAEAKKQRFDVASPEFELFSERISTIVELVLTGAVKIEDIAFEPGVNETPPAGDPPPPAQ